MSAAFCNHISLPERYLTFQGEEKRQVLIGKVQLLLIFSSYLFFKITRGWFFSKALHANNSELNILKDQFETFLTRYSNRVHVQAQYYFPQVKTLLYVGKVISNLDFTTLQEQKEQLQLRTSLRLKSLNKAAINITQNTDTLRKFTRDFLGDSKGSIKQVLLTCTGSHYS